MKKIICLFMILSIVIVYTGCGSSIVITDDNIVRVQKQSDNVLNQSDQQTGNVSPEEIQESEAFNLEAWKDMLSKRVITQMSDKHVSVSIDAEVRIPQITVMPGRYRAEIVNLGSEEKLKLVDYLWGAEAENVKNNDSYKDYGFYQDMLGARLLFDKTIVYSNENAKPFAQRNRSFLTDQAVNVELTMEEARSLCVGLLELIGYQDMQLVSPGIVQPIDWSKEIEGGYVTDKGYYYLGFSQTINGIPIKGWLDNQNVWDAYMGPGNRTAEIFFSVDDTGIFKIQGNLYDLYLQEEYMELLPMEEVLKQLETQLTGIVISGIDGKYGTTPEEIMTEIPICEIEMVYLLDANGKGEFYFDPYWRFAIGESVVDGTVLTNVCVNAVTGEVGVCIE